MKNLISFVLMLASIFALNTNANAQCSGSEFEIEVKIETDRWGYETRWELKENNVLVASGGNPVAQPNGRAAAATDPGAYANSSTFTENVCVSNISAIQFYIVDDFGDGIVDGGGYTLTIDGTVYATTGSFGESQTINVQLPLPALDAQILDLIKLGDNIALGKHWIEGTLKNFGTSAITSYTINWSIDDGTARSQNFTNTIDPFTTYHWMHDLGWNAESAGSYTVKVWVNNVNGTTEVNHQITHPTNVFAAKRKVITEYWTNAGCPPCALYIPPLEGVINDGISYSTAIGYHSDWPGTDPMNQDNPTQPATRGNYYTINSSSTGYPSAVIDGNYKAGNPAGFTANDIYTRANATTPFVIDNATLSIDNGIISFSADISSTAITSGTFVAHMVVVEKEIKFATAAGSTGETHFEWVMRSMEPGVNGTILSNQFNPGQTESVSGSWTITAANGNHGVQNPEELGVVFFVQDNATKEIHQSLYIDQKGEPDVTVPTAIHELGDESLIKLYPNPISDNFNIDLKLKEGADIEVSIFNNIGQQVKSILLNSVSAGSNKYSINTADLKAGIYLVNIQIGEKIVTDRIVVTK